MNRCETCKYWESESGFRGECTHDKLNATIGPDLNGLYGYSGTGALVQIQTGGNFGCIHHEPKEDE